MGTLEDVDMSDPKEALNALWASPVFMAEKVGYLFGRVVCDYDAPNKESEYQANPPPDGEGVMRRAAGKAHHTTMDMCGGSLSYLLGSAPRLFSP